MAEAYQFRETYRGPRTVSAEIVGRELAVLEKAGDLTASRVFQAATPAKSPLHPIFEWDKDVCFREHNLTMARQLIRSVIRVPVETNPDATQPVNVWVHVPDKSGAEGKYVRPEVVIQHIDEYERALGEARRDLDSAERRFLELRRLADARGGKVEALAIAAQGFSAVREALALLA